MGGLLGNASGIDPLTMAACGSLAWNVLPRCSRENFSLYLKTSPPCSLPYRLPLSIQQTPSIYFAQAPCLELGISGLKHSSPWVYHPYPVPWVSARPWSCRTWDPVLALSLRSCCVTLGRTCHPCPQILHPHPPVLL